MERIGIARSQDSSDLVQVATGIWRLRIPIPVPLRFVNCYLLQGPGAEWAVVDAAMHDENSEGAWLSAFGRLRIYPRHVSKLLVTHYHPDHYGAAGWLQAMTGAEVLMLDREVAGLPAMYAPGLADFSHYLMRSGVPAKLVEEIAADHEVTRSTRVVPHPQITSFQAGSDLRLGEHRLEVVLAPGHTDGSAVFLSRDSSMMIAGDVVLAGITPNISYFEGFSADPLAKYLDTLRRLQEFTPALTLAGHRQPILDLPARCAEIRLHHEERLAKTFELASRQATAWDVACGLFGNLVQTNTMFAVGEALSHLEYLVGRGELASRSEAARTYYGIPGSHLGISQDSAVRDR